MADPKISIRNLYKIFGDDPQSVLDFAKQGMGKDELFDEYRHVLGLRDINVAAQHLLVSEIAYENLGQFILDRPDASARS